MWRRPHVALPGRRGTGRLRALRVLVVAQQLRRAAPGGIGTYVRGLVAGLVADGGDTGAGVDADAGGLALSLLASRAPRAADPVAHLGPPVLTSPLPAPLLTRAWHAGLLRAPAGFDIVHAASFNAPRCASPLTIAVHDLAWRVVPDTFPDRGRRWHDAALSKAMRRATKLLVPSTVAADQLMSTGAGAAQVEVVDPMYGCDHLPPPDPEAATALLSDLGVTGPYLLSVGTLEPRKNLARLMEAYGRALPSFPEPWPLVVVGPRGWGDSPATGLPDGVLLAGAVPGPVLTALYAGARAVAYVPLHEGFGLPAVEAMSAGAPVVASPMPSTGGAALETDPLDVVSMAGALVEVATDERCRHDLIAAGRARAGRLTWAAAANRHLDLWSRLT
ncbi:MAG TPA: glycosyltransferase family 1 protein [Acidimicrobiales bacterium]|nr:glycosyltransferase family 1 protein [Acidimicrobiales bacterium]